MTQLVNDRNVNQPAEEASARTGPPLVLAFESGGEDLPAPGASLKQASGWKLTAAGGVGFFLAIIITVAIVAVGRQEHLPTAKQSVPQQFASAGLAQYDLLSPPAPNAVRSEAALKARAVAHEESAGSAAGARAVSTSQPMIARTASLTIQVKDFAAARGALESILAKHHGYSATLTIETPENGQSHFQASLRVPANELTAALEDLKKLGRVITESQSGEEVTQQHTDLLARLQNSRETEERLRAILQQRTGKIEDVLQVEEEIARVRGEIESMEADQRTLEHRVDFAGIELQFVEEYKEEFNASPASAMGRLRNGFVAGMRKASGTLLGLAVFIEEFGPAMLIWFTILGLPAYLVWRRYRRTRATT